jgi:hypothetical protein
VGSVLGERTGLSPNDFKVRIPSFEEGRPRRSNDGTLAQEIGVAGREAQARQRAASREVKPILQQVSDLPRRADFKVALHLLDRRGAPSSKEGIGSSSSLMQQFGNSPSQGGEFVRDFCFRI